MGWVVDEDYTYAALNTALYYMLESGRNGYVEFTSAIVNYRRDFGVRPYDRTK
jgi:hypothetical protein